MTVATFLNGDYSRAVPLVSSFFTIKDLQRNKDDYVEFLVAESSIKDAFPRLLEELGKMRMVATARRSNYVSRPMPTLSSARLSVDNGVVITVARLPPRKDRGRRKVPVPILLFIATVATVLIDGVYRSDGFANAFSQNSFTLSVVYTVSLMGILGIHELGHLATARKYGIKTSWPYFIPGIPSIPNIPSIIPTFGAMIQLRSGMTNRDVMFDIGIAGPIAGLLVTIVVSIYGSSISVLIPVEQMQSMDGDVQVINVSLLMQAILQLTGNSAEGMVLVLSPVLYAAWLGFLLTFINLMPAWQLDGGHLARTALGVGWHRIFTYASVVILVGLGYWPMAILVLILSSRVPASTPLDDVSPLSRGRKVLFLLALGLAVLCASPAPSFRL